MPQTDIVVKLINPIFASGVKKDECLSFFSVSLTITVFMVNNFSVLYQAHEVGGLASNGKLRVIY